MRYDYAYYGFPGGEVIFAESQEVTYHYKSLEVVLPDIDTSNFIFGNSGYNGATIGHIPYVFLYREIPTAE